VLKQAVTLISAIEDEEKREVLAPIAADLAQIRLSTSTINSPWEETTMPIPSFAEALAEEKYQDGLEKGRERMVTDMLRHRFGSDERIAALARRLASLDSEEFLSRYDRAASLDDLTSG
jgi:hypothetical protein